MTKTQSTTGPINQPTTEWTPEGGDIAAPAFKRSWKKGARTPGSYEASFEYEGTTVFINSLAKADWEDFESSEKALVKETQEFQDEVNARVEVEKAKAAQRARSQVKLAPEQLEAERLEEMSVAEAWTNRKDELAAMQALAMHKVVSLSVVGWENAPIPYTFDALQDMPEEIIADWAGIIIEKSRLSAKEGRFLARK